MYRSSNLQVKYVSTMTCYNAICIEIMHRLLQKKTAVAKLLISALDHYFRIAIYACLFRFVFPLCGVH